MPGRGAAARARADDPKPGSARHRGSRRLACAGNREHRPTLDPDEPLLSLPEHEAQRPGRKVGVGLRKPRPGGLHDLPCGTRVE
eukprot:15431382-Alexandrium_andersonii.AAC.1